MHADGTGTRVDRGHGEIGFIGLGLIGLPMAVNLADRGVRLVAWNRSSERAEPLRQMGAHVASTVDEVFRRCETVFLMLANEGVTDHVLGRGTPEFAERVSGRLLVSAGSVTPDYSRGLAADIVVAGGRFVETPVGGSTKQAETGELVAMCGGDPQDIDEIRPLLDAMFRDTIVCGTAGHGLLMKLALNHYVVVAAAALAEIVHYADRIGLDLNAFQHAFEAGPLASEFTRFKLPKLVQRDFSVHATTTDVCENTRLIGEVARDANVAAPLLDLSRELYLENVARGNADVDVLSVIEVFEARTADRNRR
ncbi:NAD(P)-dependent oxidoreductase [Gordonia sp. TBRC 11910]|uniref:NAD(P)-dependent oxidoreductase n=1 Tax=Gordonia asplenii TaxID=2725283 RepID=A0A848L7N1_9ACTN|nr:NAD(P)-dependent oxidoreductase [Gordonia asplenii]NMO04491.1 NAD(P)-dependent oxidoreductase [Gordonia asplenii]